MKPCFLEANTVHCEGSEGLGHVAAQNHEPRIARFQNRRPGIGRVSGARSTRVSRIAVELELRKIDSEPLIRIATYQCLAATLESHDLGIARFSIRNRRPLSPDCGDLLVKNYEINSHRIFPNASEEMVESYRINLLVIYQSTLSGSNLQEISKRGWQAERVGAMRSFLCQRFRPLFCTLLPMPSSGEGKRNSGDQFLLYFGPCKSPTSSRQQEKAHKLLHIRLCPVTQVTGLLGQVPGQKYLCSLGSEDSTMGNEMISKFIQKGPILKLQWSTKSSEIKSCGDL